MARILLALTTGSLLACGDRLALSNGTPDDVPDEGLLCSQSLLQLHSPSVLPRDQLARDPLHRAGMWASRGSILSAIASLSDAAASAVAFLSYAFRAAAGADRFPRTVPGNRTQARQHLAVFTARQSPQPPLLPAPPLLPDPVGSTETDAHPEDLFPPQGTPNKDIDPGFAFFMSAPPLDWLILFVVCVVLFVFDMLVLQRFQQSFRTHVWTLVFWVFVAVAFCILTYFRFGKELALNWCTGYLLEWILSMDNLFVFHLVFETYKTPAKQTHKAVFLGIVGAVVIRMIFFIAVSGLLNAFQWVRYPFGALLIWSGIQAARGEDEDDDVKDTYIVRGCKWLLGNRLLEDYDGEGRLVVTKDGTTQFTLLLLVVAIIELSDVLFALDSVSAKIAQIPQQYIAFSSTCIAMYGLRALFFIVKDLVKMFELLQYGLCLILVWIGLELMLSHWLHVGAGAVCVLIASIFAVFTVASVARRRVIGEADSKEPSTKASSRESPDDAFESEATASNADSAQGNKAFRAS
mmetsp:Transcript_84224/g.204225  ORF Transcript_84224/g.204225 Transcript_84224/m.204225 type:complete len:521 (+) Transcript_84224:82-1644(+)